MTEADVLRMVVSLAFIVFVLLAGAWLLRRAGWLRAGASQAITVLGAHSLGARSSVAVVQVEDARLVVGVTPQQITLLHTLPPADTNPSQNSESPALARPGFAQSLRSALRQRGGSSIQQP
ncbi:MAG TPA: flagellar biosynthetic protein FliO [Pusillimonas sp.]|uniref:flagellar biosynthetic protein FliO n=1 Tax=Pusillimonas sp. TaxID=3040095 RepID=UPI002D00A792|nr:flagellar biosynthetic protein FliO [Pusillimonas sp.]HUH88900.1 flagellar biosynthetic protein FliO [Pusillimonas sp.]